MLQIIHDVAPGAKLLFHSFGRTERDFATAVQALTKAGADIIVDDVSFATEPFFQDGVAAQAVAAATKQGILYFAAAGNSGKRAYQSPFRAGSTFVFRGSTYEAHDFDSGDGVDLFQDIQMSKKNVIIPLLNWNQPIGQVNSDLEMFLLDRPQFPNSDSKLLGKDFLLLPSGSDDAIKAIAYQAPAKQTVYLVIARRVDSVGSAPSLMQWTSFANNADAGTTYQYVNDTPEAMGAPTIFGHANAEGAIAVGATFFGLTPFYTNEPPVLEDYSSRGSTPILFDQQGDRLPIPILRQKPDLIAPTGVFTTVPGFEFFFGTSAAAPHAAAVAALMLQRAGGSKRLTPSQILTAMQTTAIPIAMPDSFSMGSGFLQANSAVINSFVSQQIGTPGNDRIRGNQTAENIIGLAGDDNLSGLGGYDVIFGGQGRDRLEGDRGNDYLVGDRGNDVLLGGKGNDTLIGGRGNDILIGDAGKNRLRGGSGQDNFILWLGGQPDRFAIIQDFQVGQDKLSLTGELNFEQLNFIQQDNATLLSFQGKEIARLNHVVAGSLTRANFVSPGKLPA